MSGMLRSCRCWDVIEKQTVEAVTSDEFVTLKRSVVESATSFPGSSLFLARESTPGCDWSRVCQIFVDSRKMIGGRGRTVKVCLH